MDELKYYNSPITLEQAEQYIQNGLVTAARAYVANGYYLRRIRDDKLFEESGYQNFEDYVRGKYNKDKGWASKCIKVNQQLSDGGDSPILSKQYLEYSTYQLVELAYMTEEQREEADPDMTVNQLKQIRKPEEVVESEKSCDVTTSESEEECGQTVDEAEIQGAEEKRKKDWLIRCEVLKQMCNALCDMHSYGLEKDNYSMTAIQRISIGSCGFGFGDDGSGHSKYNAEYEKSRYYVEEFDGTGSWVFESGEVDQHIWNFNGREWHNAHPNQQKQETSQINDIGYYNPDDEKEVDESYSFVGIPKASDRHVTMFARLFVQDNAKKLIYGGVAIGITDERIIEMLKLFYRSQKLIIIDNDVEVSVCAEIIEFSRDDEDLGICLFQKFANYVRKQIDEYVEKQLAEEKSEENPKNVIEQPGSVPEEDENVPDSSENVIDGEYEEVPPEQEPQEYTPRYFLEDQKDKLDNYLRIMKGKELLPADIKAIECQKTIVAALACMVAELEKPEPLKQDQPELPILKNNDQRAAFIDAYESWPIWIETKETGERYYRYDLSEKAAIVVKVYWKHSWESYKESKDYEYGAAQYYLMGVKSEWHNGKNVYVEDESRTFYKCGTNRSALVEYLKDFQKSK